MAEARHIALLVDRCLVYARKHTPEERQAAIDVWVRQFGDVRLSVLQDAVDAWIAAIDEDGPNPSLPRVKALEALFPPTGPTAARKSVVARRTPRDYMRAHLEAGRRIEKLAGAATRSLDEAKRIEHEHVPPTYDDDGEVIYDGTEDCPRCNEEVRLARSNVTKAKIANILADLPQPTHEVTRPCKCDGSGIVDTVTALTDDMLSLNCGPRLVYPCSQCNPELFDWWSKAGDGPMPDRPRRSKKKAKTE